MWRFPRPRRAAPVTRIAEDVQPRRRWLRLPTFGGTWVRRQRTAQPVQFAPLIPGAPMVAREMDEMDEIDDETDDEIHDFWLPDDVNEWPAFFLRTLVVPIPGHVEGSDQNEVINLSKLVLFSLVPQGEPRQLDAVDLVPGTIQRSASAPGRLRMGKSSGNVHARGLPPRCHEI